MSTSSLVQALPEAWRSTNGLAILGSLGIHTLLLVVLPFVSLDPQEVNLQSSIGVVELSPEERSRVPQVAADPSVIPPVNTAQQQAPAPAQGFQSEILPPLPAPSPFLPPPPGTTPMYQMPSSDSLPPPAPIPLPPPPQNLLSQNPFGQPPAPQPNQANQNLQMRQIAPPANALPPIPDLPRTQDLQPSPPLTQPPKNSPDRAQLERMARQNALAQRLAANRSKADTSPTSDRERLLDAAAQQQVQRAKEREERASRLAASLQQRQQRQSNPTQTTPPATNPNSDRASRLAAILQQRQQRQSNPTQTTPPATNPNSDRASRLAALQQRLARPIGARPDFKAESGSTQTIAQIEALQQQYLKVQQAYPQFVTAAPIRKRVPVCNKKLNGGEAIIAALTDPTGKIVIGPDVISKDSPSAVQQAAIRYVKRYPFTKSAAPVNQTFRLEFSHNPRLCSRK
ncbi:hypothetical protein [Chroococcidiopsis sp.]|uniref:hypothetical protein n=1 Tax=Chroococcidiopsis sp. TaxID=3088168 RepID=UPI003F3DF669